MEPENNEGVWMCECRPNCLSIKKPFDFKELDEKLDKVKRKYGGGFAYYVKKD